MRGWVLGPARDETSPTNAFFHFLALRFIGLKNGGWAASGSHLDDSGDQAGALHEGGSALRVCVCPMEWAWP